MKYKIGEMSNDVIDTILKNRNITYDEVDEILTANRDNWENPLNYKNMDRAYNTLMEVVRNNGNVAVLIDPDCDGYISATIMFDFIYYYLEYDSVSFIIQSLPKARGLTEEVMNIVQKNNVNLLITPDSSSNDFEQQKKLHELGIKFIALDHHEFDSSKVPKESIIVNNQDGQVENIYGSGSLVTYKFVNYVAEKEFIDIGYDYMDLVNIANIGDMMDMTSLENRYFYNTGKKVKNISNALVLEFVKTLKKRKYLTIKDVAFNISNKINSIVRNGSYEEKRDLFLALNGDETKVEYTYRGKTKTQSLQEAIIRIGNRLKNNQNKLLSDVDEDNLGIFTEDNDKIVVIDGSSINRNVTGLMANKLLHKYGKPILIVKKNEEGEYSGSARGIGIESFKDICEGSKLFSLTEGHGNAFGVSIPKENIHKFIEYANKELKDIEFDNSTIVDYVYEENIPLEDVIDLGELSELWCNDVEKPILLIKDVIVNSEDIDKKFNTVKFKVDNILYKKDFCSKIFYEKLINLENNEDIDKDLKMDILCTISSFENGRSYVEIIDVESEVI